MPIWLQTSLLLAASNIFMTFAWYGHLKNLATSPWYIAALVSWGIALFEYLLQVPANRIGAQELNLAQLKIMQEAITLVVFVPFAVLYMQQPLKLDLGLRVHVGSRLIQDPNRWLCRQSSRKSQNLLFAHRDIGSTLLKLFVALKPSFKTQLSHGLL